MAVVLHCLVAVLLLFLAVVASPAEGKQATDAGDRAAMVEIAAALGADVALQWSSSEDPCSWQRVSCDGSGRVTAVQVGGRSLGGTLPAAVRNLTALARLELMSNSISGPLPSLSGLASLQILLLHGNRFSSIPGDFFAGLSSLQAVSLDDNPLGSIPPSLVDATAVVNFTASNCSIAGSIPSFFGTAFPALNRLSLSYNLLEGPVPASFASSPVQLLLLNSQKGKQLLSGGIDFVGNMTSLKQLWLHSNSFTGPLPDFSLLTSLQDLRLRDNLLTGPVPQSLMSLSSLTNVLLAGNHLQGPMPVFGKGVVVELENNNFCLAQPGPCDPRIATLLGIAGGFGYPIKFAQSWEGNDPCTGDWAGITCGAGNEITIINFQNFGLDGTVSPVFSNLTAIQSIVLARNNISGTIPEPLTTLKQLKKLDLSYNNLFGDLPTFPSSVDVDVSNNPNLGKPAPPEIYNGGNGSTSDPGSSNKKPRSSGAVGVFIACVIAAVVAFFLICVYAYYRSRKKRKLPPLNKDGAVKMQNQVIFLPGKTGFVAELMKLKAVISQYTSGRSDTNSNSSNDSNNLPIGNGMTFEHLSRATDAFSNHNLLGCGGFGNVYRGVMDDGTNVAVKRMAPGAMPSNGIKEFRAEIEVLSKFRHRNIVCLLGYCCEGDEKLLVYEFMPEGTLTHHLHDWEKEGKKPLEWRRRLNIALDVARGIEYLHCMSNESFIHRDLKPSNILLGKDMNAKVADFGLIRNAPDGNNVSVVTRLAGTFGYMAPEYATTGRVTTKADVYSYGVILMELITGLKALDENLSKQNLHLVKWFRQKISSNQLHDTIDPYVSQDEDTLNVVTKVSELAIHCCQKEPHSRPDMGYVIHVLSSFTDIWQPSTSDLVDHSTNNNISLVQMVEGWKSNPDDSYMLGMV